MLTLLAITALASTLEQDRVQATALLSEEPQAAAALLKPWVERYPQDYGLRLELAWAEYLAGDLHAALGDYRVASGLSDGAWDARLGITACEVRLQRPGARRSVRLLRQERPDSPQVRELSAMLPSAWRASFGVEGGRLSPNGLRDAMGGARTGLRRDGVVSGGVVVGAWGYVTPSDLDVADPDATARNGNGNGSGNGPGSGTGLGGYQGGVVAARSPWSAELEAGLSTSVWVHMSNQLGPFRMRGAAAALVDIGVPSPGFVAGGGASWQGPITLGFEGSWTRPAGIAQSIGNLSASAWIPVGTFAFEPGGRLQLPGGALWPGADLSAYLVRPHGAVWIGGRLGNEVHSTDLELLTTVRWPDPVAGSAWAGARVGRLDRTFVTIEASLPFLTTGEPLPWLALAIDFPLGGPL